MAAHEAARTLKIGEDLTRIMGDRLLIGSPRAPAAPTPAPAAATPAVAPAPAGSPSIPEWAVVADAAFLRDLKHWALVDLTVRQTRDHRALSAAGLGPCKRRTQPSICGQTGSDARRRAAYRGDREKRCRCHPDP